jgi:hypothetical protein
VYRFLGSGGSRGHHVNPTIEKAAVLSEDGRSRYLLSRTWDDRPPVSCLAAVCRYLVTGADSMARCTSGATGLSLTSVRP